jgi:hypothetical protein
MATGWNSGAVTTMGGCLKLGALLCAILCTVLFIRTPVSANIHFTRLCIGTFIGYIIITLGYLVGHLSGTRTRIQELIHNAVGAILFLVIGIMMIRESVGRGGGEYNYGVATGVIALIGSLLFFLDSGAAYRYG